MTGSTDAGANTVTQPDHTRRRLEGLLTSLVTIVITSAIIDAILYAIASRSAYAGVAKYLATLADSVRPMGHALAVSVFGMLAATAGAAVTLGRVAASDLNWYPLLLLATTICAWAASALRRLQFEA